MTRTAFSPEGVTFGVSLVALGVLGTLDAGMQRSVGIGSVTTDAMGRYTLLLPPTL